MSTDTDSVIKGTDSTRDNAESVFPSWAEIWEHCGFDRNTELSMTQLALAVQAHPDTTTSTTSGAKSRVQQAAKEDDLLVRKVRAHQLGDDEAVMTVSGYVPTKKGGEDR